MSCGFKRTYWWLWRKRFLTCVFSDSASSQMRCRYFILNRRDTCVSFLSTHVLENDCSSRWVTCASLLTATTHSQRIRTVLNVHTCSRSQKIVFGILRTGKKKKSLTVRKLQYLLFLWIIFPDLQSSWLYFDRRGTCFSDRRRTYLGNLPTNVLATLSKRERLLGTQVWRQELLNYSVRCGATHPRARYAASQ